MIVGQKIKSHSGYFGQELIECRGVGGGRDVIAMAGPD
jgi:hypothetical protein